MPGHTVSVIDPSNTVVATVDVGNEPLDVAVSPTGPDAGFIYVTHGGNMVSVINPATHAVSTITVGQGAGGVAVSRIGPEAGDVYTTNDVDGTVTVIS